MTEREARNAYMRAYQRTPKGRANHREMNRRYVERHRDQKRAWSAVGNAIRDGRLVPQPCAVCGSPLANAHHHNGYGPGHQLDVVWLCDTHHKAAHAEARGEAA
jgi:hypothetical protein